MNSTIIEQIGINAFKKLLLDTKIIIPQIKDMDKYPIWDGELLVYNDTDLSAENLNVRVPIQIKSELKDGEKNSKEKYSVKISHLNKYADEGGVLFIKIVENPKKDENYFYSNLLMKADILSLLEKVPETQETMTINLEEFKSGGEIITMCLNFKLHRKLQMQIPTKNSLDQLKRDKEIYTYGYIDNIEDIVKKEQYGYVKVEGDLLGYIGKVKTDALYGRKMIPIYTKKKLYYNYVTEVIKAKEHYYEINENAILKDEKLTLNSFAKKELTLDRAIGNLEFVQDLYQNKKLKIGNSGLVSLSYEEIEAKELKYNMDNVENNLSYLYSAKKTLNMLNIATDKVTVQDVIDIENDVCKIRDIIVNKEKLIFDDEKNDTFVLIEKMKDITFLVYFIRQPDGTYIGYDYLQCQEIMNNLKVEIDKEIIQLSRFYNLKADVLVGLNFDEKKLFEELKLCTKNCETIDFICYLMMEFIKTYDMTKDIKFLNIAIKMNRFLRKQREYYSEELYKINNYQILKRKNKKLDKEIKNKITIIKVKTINIYRKMACCLLLEQYDEFAIIFKELKKEEKEIYKTWAIFNLLPDVNKVELN